MILRDAAAPGWPMIREKDIMLAARRKSFNYQQTSQPDIIVIRVFPQEINETRLTRTGTLVHSSLLTTLAARFSRKDFFTQTRLIHSVFNTSLQLARLIARALMSYFTNRHSLFNECNGSFSFRANQHLLWAKPIPSRKR